MAQIAIARISISLCSLVRSILGIKIIYFPAYIGTRLNSLIELEPAYNEVRALEQIKNKK